MKSQESLFRSLVVSVVPLFMGSLLFSGLIESYKAEVSDRRALVEDHLKPILQAGHSCSKLQHKLIVKNTELGGSYIVLYGELKKLAASGFKNPPPAYAGFLQGVSDAPGKAVSEINKLEDELAQCKGDLFRVYLEAAAATGTYREFEPLSDGRDKKHREIIEKSNEIFKKLLKNNEPNKILDMLRNLAISPEDAATLSSSITEFGSLSSDLAEYQKERANLEQQLASIDRDFHAQVVRLLSQELSARNQRGWVSRWLF